MKERKNRSLFGWVQSSLGAIKRASPLFRCQGGISSPTDRKRNSPRFAVAEGDGKAPGAQNGAAVLRARGFVRPFKKASRAGAALFLSVGEEAERGGNTSDASHIKPAFF